MTTSDKIRHREIQLQRANDVRHRRHVLREELKSGEQLPSDVLGNGPFPEWLAGMKLDTLLESTRGIGPSRANMILRRVAVEPGYLLRWLNARQRRELASILREKGR